MAAGALAKYSAYALVLSILLAPEVSLAADESYSGVIIVTATRREVTVQDVPYNISAYSEGYLNEAGVTDISDIAQIAPGVAYINEGSRPGANNNGFIIRGLRGTQLASANDEPESIEPSVSTYLGDTPLFFPIVLKDIERVEVLRGPQGTLYGSGAVGGTIRFIPRKPDPDAGLTYELSAEGSYTKGADDPGYQGHAVLNIPLADNMALRTAFGHIYESGFIDNNAVAVIGADGAPVLSDPGDFMGSSYETKSVKNFNESNTDYAKLSVWWGITDSVDLTLNYYYQDVNSRGRQVYNPAATIGGAFAVTTPYTEPQTSTLNLFSAELNVDTGIGQLTSSSSYYKIDTDLFADATNFYGSILVGNFLGFPRLTAYRGSADSSSGPDFGLFKQKAFVQEVRLVSNPGDIFDWVVGGYFTRQDTDFDLADNVPGFADWADAYYGMALGAQGLPQLREQIDKRFEDKALFGELTWHITDKWDVTGGARAFWQKTTGSKVLSSPAPAAIMTSLNFGTADPDFLTSSFSLDNSVSNQIFKLNTSYELSDNARLYATWSEGFRRGGSNAIYTSLGADPALLTYAPDTATNWEVGLKGRLGGFANFSVAGYYIDWNNFQFSGTEPVVGNLFVGNGKSARALGIESELSGKLGSSVDFNIGYTFTDAQVTDDFLTSPGNPASLVAAGDPLPGTPKHMATFLVNYTHPLASGDELSFRLGGSYRSSTVNAFNPFDFNYAKIDGFGMLDAAITYKHDTWNASIFADNLTNSKGITTGLYAPYFPAQYETRQIARPFTVGLRVTIGG